MNKIIVYQHENFKGLSREFTSDIRDLRQVDFDDTISSLKVIGQPWVAFRDPDYRGHICAYEEGEHRCLNTYLNDHISSLQLVNEDLEDPQITLYEHPNYGGQSKVLTNETDLTAGYFDDKASSHIVQRGAWVLYDHPNRGGWYYVARSGERLPNYGTIGFHDRCSHVRPLQSGRPIVTAKVLWEQKKVEKEKEIVIDEIVGTNRTDHEQTFTTTTSKEYQTSTTHSFNFSSSSTLRIGAKVEVGIPGFSVSVETEISTTLTFEKGTSESTTTREKVEVSLPAKTPPHTELTINVVKKEVTISVPVELTIMQGGKMKTEHGEYRSTSGRSIRTEYTAKKI
ncbi:epidermal differentiation-specific protein-like [Emydura macquarii macquarii]|uniref:epidermal differentiation-specific protein-like n=1 Tax=Emydura macquarii macquarii TaxID=1129001 RepID=UPI00352AC99E